MRLHDGQTVEKIIRRDGYSISQLARMMNINRRSIYNWFNQPVLRQEIIYKIGRQIMHDFSVEFPELFSPADFVFDYKPTFSAEECIKESAFQELSEESSEFKEKYLSLYPRYMRLLNQVRQNQSASAQL